MPKAKPKKPTTFTKQAPPRVDALTLIWKADPSEAGRMGITAKAQVSYALATGDRRLEWLTSGGLWGVDTALPQDPTIATRTREYLQELEEEELEDLRRHLEHFNIHPTDDAWRELRRTLRKAE